MKRILLFLIAAGIIVLSGLGCAGQFTTIKDTTSVPERSVVAGNEVAIKNFAFSPAELRIKKGETVAWTNEDSAPHTVTSDTGNELSPTILKKGDSYAHTFNNAGTYNYHCSFHSSMKAIIIVE